MKLGIIGTGYVGLVTGACLADHGHTVHCIDIDAKKVARLSKGELPIYEPELDELVNRNIEKNRLQFTTDLASCINEVDALFLAVGTPPRADHSADLSAVEAASRQIGQLLNKYLVVITKSTVPVGTSELVRKTIQENLANDVTFDVASNPEFLREGAAVRDFMEPDRIVVGVDSERAESILREIYKPFIQNDHPFIVTTIKSAEVIKYASNAFLATKISFINEVANFCEVAGATIDDVAKGMGLDSRIGHKYLHAGLGYGGSCFPKDIKALVATGKSFGSPFRLLEAVETINQHQQLRVVTKLAQHLGDLKGKTVAIWGLAFKAKTDDIREAPALRIIEALRDAGAKVQVFDPVVKQIEYDVVMSEDAISACKDADGLLIVTEWEDFLYPDFKALKKQLKNPLIIDGRNLYTPEAVVAEGFVYDSIGRPKRSS